MSYWGVDAWTHAGDSVVPPAYGHCQVVQGTFLVAIGYAFPKRHDGNFTSKFFYTSDHFHPINQSIYLILRMHMRFNKIIQDATL